MASLTPTEGTQSRNRFVLNSGLESTGGSLPNTPFAARVHGILTYPLCECKKSAGVARQCSYTRNSSAQMYAIEARIGFVRMREKAFLVRRIAPLRLPKGNSELSFRKDETLDLLVELMIRVTNMSFCRASVPGSVGCLLKGCT